MSLLILEILTRDQTSSHWLRVFVKCAFTQRTVTQVDRRLHSAREEDRALSLLVPMLTALLLARELLWGPGAFEVQNNLG